MVGDRDTPLTPDGEDFLHSAGSAAGRQTWLDIDVGPASLIAERTCREDACGCAGFSRLADWIPADVVVLVWVGAGTRGERAVFQTVGGSP